jgi:GTPase
MAEVSVNRNILENLNQGIKITMLGCEAAGKSTLIGVLISGQNDDGLGTARVHVHKHYSEILDGKTTSTYSHILGFNSDGEITNLSKFGNLTW